MFQRSFPSSTLHLFLAYFFFFFSSCPCSQICLSLARGNVMTLILFNVVDPHLKNIILSNFSSSYFKPFYGYYISIISGKWMEVQWWKHKKSLHSTAQLMQSPLAAWKKTINNQWLEGDLISQFSATAINIFLTTDRLLQICDVSPQWLLFLSKSLISSHPKNPGLL